MVSATMVVATMPVSDLGKARVFHGETLGLTFLWENPASIRFRCGDNSELSVFRRPSTVTEHTLAHFEVTDLESEVAHEYQVGSQTRETDDQALSYEDGEHTIPCDEMPVAKREQIGRTDPGQGEIALDADRLITHRFPIAQAAQALHMTANPGQGLKALVVMT